MLFLRHELFWFCLVQVSTTTFRCFPPVFMPRVDDASDRPVPPSPVQLSSSNFGSLNGSGPDIDGLATRPGTSSDEKFDGNLSKLAHFDVHLAQFPVLQNLTSRMESHVTTTLGGFAARLAEKGQHFSAPSARMCKIETSAVSASSVFGSARSWALT